MRDTVCIYSVKYADAVLPEDQIFYGGSRNRYYPITFCIFLVFTGDKKVLIDAGCDTMPGFEMKNFISPKTALEQIGVHAPEITDVVITHAHHDHIEAVGHFQHAVMHIQREEYESGKRYIPQNAAVDAFEEHTTVGAIEVQRVGGHTRGSCIAKCHPFIFAGDECYIDDCLKTRTPTGKYYDLQKSRAFVERYSHPEYRVLLCHDPKMKTERICV